MAPARTYEDEGKVIDTTLNHYLDVKDGGHDHYVTGVAKYYKRKFDERPVKIENIRGSRLNEFDLNTQGFQYYESPTIGGDFRDTQFVKDEVYAETEQLLKEVTGATRVKVFSHILRNDSRDAVEKRIKDDPNLADDTPIEDVVPARFVHIDQSEYGAMEVLNDNIHPPELAEKLKKTRWSIINVWRPIKPVFKDPLAFCDARTARDEDLMVIPVFFPPKDSGQRYATLTEGDRFELLYLRYHPDQTWYYCDGMKPGECLFVKCFDTIRDGKTARRVPHSAFVDPTNADQTKRESVEIRCLVFYEDQPVEG